MYKDLKRSCTAIVLLIKGWFTLATEATEAEAESEEKETLLILLSPIPSSFRLRLGFRFLIYTGS